jgi:hypothetical protein
MLCGLKSAPPTAIDHGQGDELGNSSFAASGLPVPFPVARGLQNLPYFAGFFRAKLLILFRINTSYRTTNQ